MNDLRIVADQQIKNGFLFIKFIMDPELLTPDNVAQFTRLASSIITQFHYGGEDGVEIRMPLEVLEKHPHNASRAKIIVQMANIANSLGASFNPAILDDLQNDMDAIRKSAKAVKEFKNETENTLIDRITNLLTATELKQRLGLFLMMNQILVYMVKLVQSSNQSGYLKGINCLHIING